MKQRLVKIAWHIFGDRVADAILWWFIFRTLKTPKDNKPRLLVLNHLFNQDLAALELANREYSLIVIDAKFLRYVATFIFPPSVESFLVYNGTKMAPLRKRWGAIMRRFVTHLQHSYHPQAVVAPSDNFFYVREFIPALQTKHIPYIVIDKEGTICPAYFVHFAQYIHEHCPLIADHILVWSERQKQFWEKTGVAADKITVTGQPRSDFWRQHDRWKTKTALGIPKLRSEAPMFLFFTYDPWAYTPDYMIEKGEMHWDILRHETHQALFSFARQHPEIDLVIKAHPQQPDIDDVQKNINAAACTNIHLASGVTLSNDLIINADCIIGFQTTALIEAMITNKPIIYTFWGEAKDRWSNDLIPFHETAGVETVTSPNQLVQGLVAHLTNTGITTEQRQARDVFINEYLTSIDGQASQRTLNAISSLLKQNYSIPKVKPSLNSMERNHRLINNTLINIISTAISFILAYAMTPVILHRLGTTDYGIWVFLSIFSVSGYFSLFELGFQGAAIKYIAEYYAKKDYHRVEEIIHASLVFFISVGLLGGLLLFLFNFFNLTSLFHLPHEHIPLIRLLINILAIGFLINFPTIAYSAILEGLQRYDYLRIISILTTILTNVTIFIWLQPGNGLVLMVWTIVLSSLFMLIGYAFVARRLLPMVSFWPNKISSQTFKLLFKLSSKLFISKIIGLIYNNTDKIIIGIFLTVNNQTEYDIINKLHILLLSLLSIMNQISLPAASHMSASNDTEGLRELVLRATKYSASMIIPAWLFLMIVPGKVLEIWVGAQYAHLAIYLQLYCAHFVLTMLIGVSSTMLVGVDKVGQVIRISIWAAVLNLIISITTIKWLGIAGLMLGTSLSYFVSSFMYVLAGNKIFSITNLQFWKQTIAPLLSATFFTSVPLVIYRFWVLSPSPWLLLGMMLFSYLLFYFTFWFTGISKTEKIAANTWYRQFFSTNPLKIF